MKDASRKTVGWLVCGLGLGLLSMGALRYSAGTPTALTPFAGLATPGYVATTVLFTILLFRAGLPMNRFGFGVRPGPRHFLLAVAAVAFLRVFAVALDPLIEEFLGGPRNLERFSGVEGSLPSLLVLLAVNWTLAAFGEEFAYRIVLMRGISYALGDSRAGLIAAVVLQAVLFGLIHAYQGPAGIAGSALSGLVFGAVTIAARWSIWPAALAHGANNTIGILALFFGE